MKLSRKQRMGLAGSLLAIGTCILQGLGRWESGQFGLAATFFLGGALGSLALGLRLRMLRNQGKH